MSKPAALANAEMLDGLCRRWGQPPSVILREDARVVHRLLGMLAEPGGE